MYDFLISDHAFSMHHQNLISYHLKNIETLVQAQHTKMTKNAYSVLTIDQVYSLAFSPRFKPPNVDAAFAAYCVASQNMEMTFE